MEVLLGMHQICCWLIVQSLGSTLFTLKGFAVCLRMASYNSKTCISMSVQLWFYLQLNNWSHLIASSLLIINQMRSQRLFYMEDDSQCICQGRFGLTCTSGRPYSYCSSYLSHVSLLQQFNNETCSSGGQTLFCNNTPRFQMNICIKWVDWRNLFRKTKRAGRNKDTYSASDSWIMQPTILFLSEPW